MNPAPLSATVPARPAARLEDSATQACVSLARALDHFGYAELCASMSPLHSANPCATLATARRQLPTDLRTLAEAFLFCESVPGDRLSSLIGPSVLEELYQAGLLQRRPNDEISTAGLMIRQLLGLWYIHERPHPEPRLYYGDDSFALLWRQQVRGFGHCLDLCCGPGLQLLHAVREGTTGIGVEINRFAVTLARLNAAMNGLHDRTRILHGNLFDPLPNAERFDHVLANPPLLPFPEDAPYPFVGDGGDDGLAVTRKILLGLPNVLHENGRAQIIGTALSDGLELTAEASLRRWATAAGLDLIVTIVAQHRHAPGSEIFEGLVHSSASTGGDPSTIREAMVGHLRRQGATHLAGLFIRAQLGSGRLVVNDVSAAQPSALFFR